MKPIDRKDITDEIYADILKRESHHDHEILVDEHGKFWWKENPEFTEMKEKIGLQNIWDLLESLGYNKNSEVIRKMYRHNGYSLFGYWELFYWEVNNPIANEYRANIEK